MYTGVESVSINSGAQTCTVTGTVEEKKLIEHIRKKVHKQGEVVKVEKKVIEKERVEVKKGKEEVEIDVVKEKEEIKISDKFVPYLIYYPHAPQWFSDENPNACCVM